MTLTLLKSYTTFCCCAGTGAMTPQPAASSQGVDAIADVPTPVLSIDERDRHCEKTDATELCLLRVPSAGSAAVADPANKATQQDLPDCARGMQEDTAVTGDLKVGKPSTETVIRLEGVSTFAATGGPGSPGTAYTEPPVAVANASAGAVRPFLIMVPC